MTLFTPEVDEVARAAKPIERGQEKPRWSKYGAKAPQRCDECCQVALESLQAGRPYGGIRQARFSRRQDGLTRLYCYGHARLQRAEDRDVYGIK